MSITIANTRGSSIKRLIIEQSGSNLAEATLTQPLIEDADTEAYDVQIEDFSIRSDVPIISTNTTIFSIYDRGDLDDTTPLEPVAHCIVGPVYNWMDLFSQISKFLRIFGGSQVPLSSIGIDSRFMMQKKLSFRGDLLFWQSYYIQLTPLFAEIFDIKKQEGDLDQKIYLIYQTSNAQGVDVPGALFKNNPLYDFPPDPPYSFALPKTIAFPPGDATATVRINSRMELFENRHRIRIDCVLPLPHELFGIGEKNQSTKMSNRYTFMEFDWPQDVMSCETKTQGTRFTNRFSVKQDVNSGNMHIIKPGLHSGLKKMIVGQSQAHRYQLFIVRKVVNEDGSISQKEEPWPMSDGDWFRLSLLFVKES